MAYVSPRLAAGAASTRTPEDVKKARLDAAFASAVAKFAPLPMPQPIRHYWKAPRNPMGGYLSYEDMKAEQLARDAAYYGPPQGPCASFRSNTVHAHTPICFCGWVEGAHIKFGRKA